MDATQIQDKARELADFANEDSSPPPSWELPTRLMGLEQELMVKGQNFEGYAAICQIAADLCQDSTLRAAFQLGQLNGMRRVPEGRKNEITSFAKTLQEELQSLPPSPRSHWLRASFGYNMGIFARDTCQFLDAVSYHEMAAEAYHALGDKEREAISCYLIAVESAHLALFRGDGNLNTKLATLNTAYDRALAVLSGVAWWVNNVHLHVMMINAWADGPLQTYAQRAISHILSLEEPAATKSAHWMRLAQAIQRIHNGDPAAQGLLQAIVDRAETDRHGDVTVTASLLLARMLRKSDPGGAKAAYRKATAWTKLKGQVPMAIAERELAALEATQS